MSKDLASPLVDFKALNLWYATDEHLLVGTQPVGVVVLLVTGLNKLLSSSFTKAYV